MNFQVPTGSSPSGIREIEEKARKREEFNRAIAAVQSPDAETARKGLAKVLSLSAKRFAPAQFSEGMWRLHGKPLPPDKETGLRLILASADQQYPSAVGQVGIFHYEGRHLPKDTEKGLKMLKAAAESGSPVSQLYLADLIESEQRDHAVRYYRMCAALGQSLCQTRLAAQLLRAGSDRVEPIAWLQLAAAAKYEPAERLLAIHLPKLTPAEATRATALSRELAPPQQPLRP